MTRRSPRGWRARRGSTFPRRWSSPARLAERTRYGENPHQGGAPSTAPASGAPASRRARQVQGKELSYNNYNDTDAAFELVAEFAEPAVVIVKHANPCGVAIGAEPARGLGAGARLRPGQRLWRHRRGQPPARRRDRRGDRRDVRRGRHRARGRRRRRPRCLARKRRAAAAGHRRDAGPDGAGAGPSARSPAASGAGARPGLGDGATS